MTKLTFVHFFFAVTVFLLGTILVAVFNLQVVQGSYYKEVAENNVVRLRRIIATRGEIYDHKYRPVVVNIPSHTLYLITGQIKDYSKLSAFLSSEFKVEDKELRALIEKTKFRSYEDVLIADNIPYEKVLTLSEKLNYFPELFFKAETTRQYLYPNHFTGYVGRINEAEYQLYKNDDYTINSQVGKTGLEKYYEVVLKGRDGREIVQVDSRGRNLNLFRAESTVQPVNGLGLVLTIDNDIQDYAENVFPGGMRGAVAVMDIRTGGILAYVSKPSYDPNLFMTRISHKDWQVLNNNVSRPMLDRVIHAAYPPGSVFKPITAGAGLEMGKIDQYTLLANCGGGLKVGQRFFRCWSSYGHGRSNVINALKVSCDTYFYDLSLKLKLDDFCAYAHQCMIGTKTGVDLPNERIGLFPDAEWYYEHVGKGVSLTGQKVNLSIGQGEVLCTPLQICAYYAGIANGGIWNQPHLLSATVGQGALKRDQILPVRKVQLPYSKLNLEVIQRGLFAVCNQPGGTATRVKVRGATTYGKTGSAENVFGRATHAWFTGYIVTEKPEIAVTVFLENAGHGGSISAPIATRILNFYMGNYQRITAPVQAPAELQEGETAPEAEAVQEPPLVVDPNEVPLETPIEEPAVDQ